MARPYDRRLRREARRTPDLRLDVRHLWLGKYVSFKDDVRMADVVEAFNAALRRELGAEVDRGRRFACITHSTGGPVVREWWDRYYVQTRRHGRCPMSHLIMLAPPNFGSALAQLGKSRLSRIRAWFSGVQPGKRMLEWLEQRIRTSTNPGAESTPTSAESVPAIFPRSAPIHRIPPPTAPRLPSAAARRSPLTDPQRAPPPPRIAARARAPSEASPSHTVPHSAATTSAHGPARASTPRRAWCSSIRRTA